MKFLCPSCKAKYQIADEKVAGRSVRMKCRKCGFMIQVSSAMAASSGFDSEPPEAGDALSLAPPAEASLAPPPAVVPAATLPKSAPKAAPAPSPAAPPVGAPGGAPSKGAPLKGPAAAAPRPPPARPTGGGTLPRPAAPPPRASAPKPAGSTSVVAAKGTVGPRPAAGAAASRAAVPSPVAPVAAPSPAAPRVAPLAPPGPVAAPIVKELPRDFEGDDEVTRMADAGALAGAFSQAFGGGGIGAAPAPESEPPISMPGDEWFVGINGVPVGPIRLSELRSKAASGSVTKESLVWRDGFEDWRPLKTYPELLAIVEEGVSSARASLTPFMPSVSEGKNLTATPAIAAVTGSPALQPSPGAMTGSAVENDDFSAFVPPRRGTSPMVWVAMVIAIGLGLTLGFVLFGGQKPPETRIVEKIVEKEVPAKDPQAPVGESPQPGGTVLADPQAPKKTGTGSGKAASTAPTKEEKPNTGLQGLNGLNGLGPSSGPNTGGPSGVTTSGAQLDGAQIQATVSRYTNSVKRRCWQPALDARAKDAPMTAKVTVTITVTGTGSVQNATTTGDPRGYTGLANCIASSVRSWQFPASGGTTIANVPFVFAGQ